MVAELRTARVFHAFAAFFDARAFTDRAKGREYAESSLTNATEQTTSIGGVYNSYCARRFSVWAPDARAAPAASYAMLGFSEPAAPERAPPATGSGRAAAQEAARRIRAQS